MSAFNAKTDARDIILQITRQVVLLTLGVVYLGTLWLTALSKAALMTTSMKILRAQVVHNLASSSHSATFAQLQQARCAKGLMLMLVMTCISCHRHVVDMQPNPCKHVSLVRRHATYAQAL